LRAGDAPLPETIHLEQNARPLNSDLVLLCYKYRYLLDLPAREAYQLIWKERWVSSERTFRRLRTFIS
jgi:hypothetical protein